MKKGVYITTLLRSKKTVFTYKDLALLWGEQNTNAARVRMNYYVRIGALYRIRQGLYTKDKNYNRLELATRIFTPAYVSFETVLAEAGIIFQYYSPIFIASYLTREIAIDNQTYTYRRIKNTILTDTTGVENKDEFSKATKERAFLDTLYINTDYHFDNLGSLDWDKIFEILPIYDNKRMTKKVKAVFGQTRTKGQT